jgi:aspartate kinase
MKIRVLKFGGTSVRTPEARLQAALRVVQAKDQGIHPVVVVSAMGRRGEPYATDTLAALLRDVDLSVEPDAREMDLAMSCGEVLSAVAFAHVLKGLGLQAMTMRGGQAGIRTDGVYGDARIMEILPIGLIEILRRGAIPVVCGFQGVWTDGSLPGAELTTLGRGGSDTTAAALGAALNAEAVEIYTDVDGLKTCDPDFVPHAPTLAKVDYAEVAEIAHLGAKVLHPRAAEIGQRFKVPIWVKNTFTESPGSLITSLDESTGRMTGVAHSGQMVWFQLDLSSLAEGHRAPLGQRTYEVLAKYRISLSMIDETPQSIGFAVPRGQFTEVRDLFDGLVIPLRGGEDRVYIMQAGQAASQETETQIGLFRDWGEPVVVPIAVSEGLTMVSVVGRDAMHQPGLFVRIMEALLAAQIPVVQVSDSESSVSVLVPESELRRCVQILHSAFELEKAG